MEMQTGYAFQMFGAQLIDRKSETRMRRARIVLRHFACRMHRIDAQTDIKRIPPCPRRSDFARKPRVLARGVKDHMIR